MGRLKDKVAIVTGGGSGIGAATSRLMAAEGAKVVVADINQDTAETVAASIRKTGADARACQADIGEIDAVKAMIDFTVKSFGRLNIVVNNAAATVMAATKDGKVETLDIGAWDDMMRINLRGTMLACKFAIPHLRAAGGGSIINLCSNSMFKGMQGITAYATSKAGIATLTKYVAAQYGREGIRCNAISPGYISSKPPTTEAVAEMKKRIEASQPSARGGVPDDIGWMAVYLASDESGFVNGQIYSVDGGALAGEVAGA